MKNSLIKKSILLIEDEKLMRITLTDALKESGYDVHPYSTGKDAIQAFNEADFDVVVADIRLPDMDGKYILKHCVENKHDTIVILMTAYGTIKDAVEAMKFGAYDYITKPFSLDEFFLIIRKAIEYRNLKEENIRLKKDLHKCYCYPNIIGESDAMKEVFSIIEKVADTDSTILIHGESGTGKELIATTIHYNSKRKDRPLIKVSCAALPETLLESELFGYEKGAFTGAIKRKQGRFELANGGTIFLDEIGDIPLSIQAKLLRVLQDKSFERLGGTETFTVDVRVIAATNKNLEDMVKKGYFREDLFFRLNVIPLYLPPLRERRGDILLLIEYFLDRYNKKFSKNVRFSKETIETLCRYTYPGNIRELENIVERCVALSEGNTIEKVDLPPHLFRNDRRKLGSLDEVLTEVEREHILRVLKTTKGNKTKAAEMLGISRKTLWEKMNAYGIE
ncbi:MAG: sigma-54 dependent transcriptional regulator [Nitrospirota bacterium]